jgi:L-ascorbate metabolism protein UlaG (beta-lactamase superfamily)
LHPYSVQMSVINKSRKEGKQYQNPIPTTQMKGGMMKLLWQFMTTRNEREPKKPLGPFITDERVYQVLPASGLRITWMGHSSLLIEIDGKRILTDPVWGARASFSSFIGPKRFFRPPLPLHQLPQLDAIILSHDHYDHLDYHTIKKLINTNTHIYCSIGVGPIIRKWGVSKARVTELDWTDSVRIGKDFSITALPARHFSGRGIVNRNQTLWSSFVIKGSKHNIFFGADSGWFPGFLDIGDAYGPFDLTMLEIGAYGDGWPDIHMGPDNATNAHLALKGKLMMPIHWGTFNLALHPWREPVELLLDLAKQKNLDLFLPKPGLPTEVTGSYNSEWWIK